MFIRGRQLSFLILCIVPDLVFSELNFVKKPVVRPNSLHAAQSTSSPKHLTRDADQKPVALNNDEEMSTRFASINQHYEALEGGLNRQEPRKVHSKSDQHDSRVKRMYRYDTHRSPAEVRPRLHDPLIIGRSLASKELLTRTELPRTADDNLLTSLCGSDVLDFGRLSSSKNLGVDGRDAVKSRNHNLNSRQNEIVFEHEPISHNTRVTSLLAIEPSRPALEADVGRTLGSSNATGARSLRDDVLNQTQANQIQQSILASMLEECKSASSLEAKLQMQSLHTTQSRHRSSPVLQRTNMSDRHHSDRDLHDHHQHHSLWFRPQPHEPHSAYNDSEEEAVTLAEYIMESIRRDSDCAAETDVAGPGNHWYTGWGDGAALATDTFQDDGQESIRTVHAEDPIPSGFWRANKLY